MTISKTKFVIFFVVFAFLFQFVSNSVLGSDVSLFPPHDDSFLGTGSEITWKSTISTILLPIKIVLIGPLLPYIDFLRQEPDTPPPFFVIGFIFYWAILALVIHYLLGRLKRS